MVVEASSHLRSHRLALAAPASAQRIYSEGWGVVDQNGTSMKSVSETRRAALINWLAAPTRIHHERPD
jgi:hypothetical protein